MPSLTLKVGEERPIATPKAFLNILSASAQFIVESPDIGVLTGKTNRHFEMGNYRSVLFVNNTDTEIDIDYEIANIRTTSSGESNVNVNNEVVVKRISEGINVNVDAVIQDGNVTVDAMPAVDVSSLPAVTVETMPTVSVNSLPAVTVDTMPAVAVSSLPAVTVEAMPAVAVNSLPAVTVDALPAVAVSSLPAVTVDTMPAIAVLPATTSTHKARVECIAGEATRLFGAGVRKSNRINIRGDQSNGVSLGGDNTVDDNSGGYLDVGMVDYVETSGELWAFNNSLVNVFVDVLELV